MTAEEIERYLSFVVRDCNLIESSLQGCRTYLLNWADDEDPGSETLRGVPLPDIQLRVDRQAFVFQNELLFLPHIEIKIGLYIADDSESKMWLDGLEKVGVYSRFVTLEGEAIDDFALWNRLEEQPE